jgi:hypothetical protein
MKIHGRIEGAVCRVSAETERTDEVVFNVVPGKRSTGAMTAAK